MSRFDRLGLLAVTGVAALLRLPGIDARGRFDADQGHDMLALLAFTRDGIVPLLGPRTSVAEFHHGAFYYFLLAPSAALSNADPVAVTAFLALLGIAAVALTWWVARAIAGPVAGPLAGAIAGLLLAVSPAAIEQSTFIWNPNPIAFFAALALAAAWKARTARGWWAVALGATGAVTQLHVLGVVFLVAILALCVLQLRRDRGVARGLVGGIGLIALLFLPLLVHELQTGFEETGFVLDYLGAGNEPLGGGPVSAILFTFLRVVGWPLVGVVTDVPAAAAILLALVVGLAAIGLLRARGAERTALAWLVGILAWSTLTLALAAPSLQRVVAGLPNDHYHAFLDPIVVLLIAVPAAGMFTSAMTAWRSSRRPVAAVAGVALAAGLAVLVSASLLRKPPHVDPDGGWPAMRAAGERIAMVSINGAIALYGLPDFKLADAVGFPLVHAGGRLWDPTDTAPMPLDAVVVACDRLFEDAIGAACGGPAEDGFMASLGGSFATGRFNLAERFDASPRTSISIYTP